MPDDNIGNIFNIPAVVAEQKAELLAPGNEEEIAMQNIKEVLDQGKTNLDELFQLCSQTQDWKMYEQFTSLMNAYISGNKKLIETKILSQRSKDSDSQTAKTINNNVFVGTPKDLQEFLAAKRKNEEDSNS